MAQSRDTSKRTSAKKSKNARRSTAGAGARGNAQPAETSMGESDEDSAEGTSATAQDRAGEHPTVAMVRGLAALVEAHGLSELIVDLPEATLTLRRTLLSPDMAARMQQAMPVGPAIPVVAAQPIPAAPARPAEPSPAAAPAPAPAAEPAADKYHIVTSPFVGTFYRRPNPDTSAYTDVGKRIEKGQVLCIIEAMKLMNEIESDVSGTVVAVLVDDGSPIEYGQPLFKIAPG